MGFSIDLFPSKYEAFKRGETVRFMPFVKCDSHQVFEGLVSWTIFKGSFTELAKGTFNLAQVVGYIETSVEEPCVLQCVAEYVSPEGEKASCRVGVPVEPERIKPVTQIPSDFDAFWKKQLARLAQVPLDVVKTPIKGGQLEVFDVTASSVKGSRPLRAFLAMPENAKKGKHPLLVYFHGAGVRSARMETLFDFLNKGFIVMDVNAHGLDNRRPREYYADLDKGELKDWHIKSFFDGEPERCYYLNMFLRDRRALDVAKSLPEWDGRNLFVRGASMGAYQTFAAASLDPQVSALSANIAAGSDILAGGWPVCSSILTLEPFKKAQLAKVSPYFDNVSFASRIKVPGYIGNGLADVTCRPDGIFAVANSYAGPKTVEHDFNRGHEMTQIQNARELAFLLSCLK